MQVLNAAPSGLPAQESVVLKALPKSLLLATPSYVAVYNTSGAVSRNGPNGVLAASMQDIAMTAGIMVRSLPNYLVLA